MDKLTRNHLEALAKAEAPELISIYMPTVVGGDQTMKNPIYLKNELQNIELRLEDLGHSPQANAARLDGAYRLVENYDFWQHQSHGLALFLGKELHHFRLPVSFQPESHLASHFHIPPLCKVLPRQGHFYILALSQNQLRLFRADELKAEEMDLGDVPTSLDEALAEDEFEKQMQHHTGPSAASGKEAGYHGHGGVEQFEKDSIIRFFQQVDKGLRPRLEPPTPLVLAGVKFLLPIYQQANAYPHLVEAAVTGNTDEWPTNRLHEAAMEIAMPIFQDEQTQALERYRQVAHSQQGSQQLEQLVPSAYRGQVDTLLLQADARVEGRYNSAENKIELGKKNSGQSEDLLNLAARQTLLTGGRVFTVDAKQMPADSPAAAILRY